MALSPDEFRALFRVGVPEGTYGSAVVGFWAKEEMKYRRDQEKRTYRGWR